MAEAPESFRLVRDRLSAIGLPDEAIAGVLTNLAHESGGDPTAVGDDDTSIGIAQWHGSRASALMNWADKQGLNPREAGTQADYLVHELRNDYPEVLAGLQKAKTAGDASRTFTLGFEKPADAEAKAAERAKDAAGALDWVRRTVVRTPMGGGQPAQIAAGSEAQPGIVDHVIEGARRGWGSGQVGLGPEAAALADKLGIAGPLIRGGAVAADVAGRAVGAGIGGGAAGVGAIAQKLGLVDATGAQQLERDLTGMGEMGAVAAPLASPTGAMSPRAVMPRGEPLPAEAPAAVRAAEPAAVKVLLNDAEPARQAVPAVEPMVSEARAIAGPVVRPNLARITSTDEAKNLIGETAEVYRGAIDEARRGVMTQEATRQLADQLAVTPEDVVANWKKGGVLNAEQMLAARDALVASAEEIMTKAKEAKERVGTANEELFQLLNRHRAVQESVQGYTAEAGRLLNSFNIMSRDGRARVVREALEHDGGQWNEIVNKLANATPDELPSVIQNLPQATTADKLHFVWINGLLSSPTTHVANILGNAVSSIGSLVESAVAEGIGRAGRAGGIKGGVQAGETVARAGGMLRGMVEGFGAAFDALRRGTLGVSKSENPLAAGYQKLVADPKSGGLKSTVSGIVHVDMLATAGRVMMPTTWLGAEDAFFKAVAYRGEITAQAVRQARAEGLVGDALKARITELGRTPTETMKAAAEQAADYQTFQSELGKAGKALQTARRDIPGGRWIVPFLKTPINLVRYAAERSPLGALRLAAPGKFKLDTAAAKQEVLARAVVGTGIGLIAADLAGQGKITGSGPGDPEERGVWLQDHQPYSIRWATSGFRTIALIRFQCRSAQSPTWCA